jgi:hypothetical protein
LLAMMLRLVFTGVNKGGITNDQKSDVV